MKKQILSLVILAVSFSALGDVYCPQQIVCNNDTCPTPNFYQITYPGYQLNGTFQFKSAIVTEGILFCYYNDFPTSMEYEIGGQAEDYKAPNNQWATYCLNQSPLLCGSYEPYHKE